MIGKQVQMLESYDPCRAMSLERLLSTEDPFTFDGDIVPVAFVKRIEETMRAEFRHFDRLERESRERAQREAAGARSLPVGNGSELRSAVGLRGQGALPDVGSNVDSVFAQRKIMPWDAMGFGAELAGTASPSAGSGNGEATGSDVGALKREAYAAARKQKVIVVASLIDKTPNLAGLARTCEIFQAEQLVLPSMRCTKEKLFETISVTANRWIPVSAVAPGPALHGFLRERRREGYSVIGLEQTSSSRCITSFDFPERVVVLLGTEGRGIPHEYMQALDTAVEIPQLGIIRSLNVHVSGALLLWEYTRQQMVKGKRSR
jgi:tRNA(Leu) C34 or U34 (ribose-2'-O)-methylase TrmL